MHKVNRHGAWEEKATSKKRILWIGILKLPICFAEKYDLGAQLYRSLMVAAQTTNGYRLQKRISRPALR